MSKNLCAMLLWFALAPFAAAQDASDDPPFEVLLSAQGIIVHAANPKLERTSTETYPAEDGDVNPTPAYSETFEHYSFETVTVLKGDLGPKFEVRLIAGERALFRPEFDPKGSAVLALAPDFGRAPDGSPRSGYVIVHRAYYPLTGDTFEAPSANGLRKWTLGEVQAELTDLDQGRRERQAQNAEPPEAVTPVLAAEDTPGEAGRPPAEAPKTRPHAARPASAFDGHGPATSEAPMEGGREPGLPRWVLIAIALVVVFGLLLVILRPGRKD